MMGKKTLLCVVMMVVLAVVLEVHGAPVTGQSTLTSVDLSLTVFDQHSAQSADTSKNYVIFAFDNEACKGESASRCGEFEVALSGAQDSTTNDPKFTKYSQHIAFGKANKDDFPDHKKDFDKAKIPLPAVLFWPAGHSRPSCKYDVPHPSPQELANWLSSKLKEMEDDDLLELAEGSELSEDASTLVCQANGGPNVVANDEVMICSDYLDDSQLLQVEKTQRSWDVKSGQSVYIGPADNSLPHQIAHVETPVQQLDSAGFETLRKQGSWVALYFYAPWCRYCTCLEPVWKKVAGALVGTQQQPNLAVAQVDGDVNPELRSLFNVTAYPTFVLVNKEGDTALGRYVGPRKAFELTRWIRDLIVADENPIVKHQFDMAEQGAVPDLHPVFPYSEQKSN